MGIVKKNKIHNPQIITDPAPDVVTVEDLGRLWVDTNSNTIKIAVRNKDTGTPELRNLLDNTDLIGIDDNYFKGINEELQMVQLQVSGDFNYDYGYDFFSDENYLTNTTQEFDDYYSFFYLEVPDTSHISYLRTISTDSGVRHIRKATGGDRYLYNGEQTPIVKYTKIVLNNDAKEIVDIIFDNKDALVSGYNLADDNRTIYIYSDPDGFYNGKQVSVKYLI